ncbi:hypothetical protein HDU83_007986 [Entophlyctis luteolus]|nr:hypothetical protein HDU83_007986 [Entophlyctis luteolus]
MESSESIDASAPHSEAAVSQALGDDESGSNASSFLMKPLWPPAHMATAAADRSTYHSAKSQTSNFSNNSETSEFLTSIDIGENGQIRNSSDSWRGPFFGKYNGVLDEFPGGISTRDDGEEADDEAGDESGADDGSHAVFGKDEVEVSVEKQAATGNSLDKLNATNIGHVKSGMDDTSEMQTPLETNKTKTRSTSAQSRAAADVNYVILDNIPPTRVSAGADLRPTHVAREKYFGQRSDEMGLTEGDLVHVRREFKDGWCLAVNLTQGKREGIVPVARLKAVRGPSKRVVRVAVGASGEGGSERTWVGSLRGGGAGGSGFSFSGGRRRSADSEMSAVVATNGMRTDSLAPRREGEGDGSGGEA